METNKNQQEQELIVPEQEDTTAETASTVQTEKNAQRKAQKGAFVKPMRAHYAGRITLGVSLIVVGVMITAGLLMPSLDLVKLAKFAPLILVVLGLEILVTAARYTDRQVKVGFGMVFLCLILIMGSVGLAVVPAVCDALHLEQWDQVAQQAQEKERAIYAQVEPASIKELHIHGGRESLFDETVEWYASVRLPGSFENKTQFSETAANILHILAEQDITDVYIRTEDERESYALSLHGVYAFGNVEAAQLEKLVEHSVNVLDANMMEISVSEQKYQEMKESGMLADAQALKDAYEEGKADGYQSAVKDLQETEMQE